MEKPNLSALYCTYISWQCRIPRAELMLQAQLAELPDYQKEMRHVIRSTSYETEDGQRWQAVGLLDLPEAGQNSEMAFTLMVTGYDSWTDIPRTSSDLEGLVDAIIEEAAVTDLSVTATFVYPADRFRSVIALPTPLSYADAGSAETIGMMIRVRDEEESTGSVNYTNAISVGADNSVVHTVQYKVAPPVDRGCITKTLQVASLFSRQWVISAKEADVDSD